MKICRNCGTANVSSGQTCYKCLASLSKADEAAKATICNNCTAANAIGAHFCYNCGQSLMPVSHFCNSCGSTNRPGDIYCLNCGRKILLDNPTREQRAAGATGIAVPVTPTQADFLAASVEAEVAAISSEMQEQQVQNLQKLSEKSIYNQGVANTVPAPVNTTAIRDSEPQKYRMTPSGAAGNVNPPQTKQQYRIQLFLMFAALGAMLFLTSKLFFVVSGIEITGIAAFLVLPCIFAPEKVAEILSKLKLDFLTDPIAVAQSIADATKLENNFAGIFAYALFGILAITLLALTIGFIVALFRLIFNKPYNKTRKGLFYLCLINAALAGIEYLALKVEFVQNIFLGDNTTFGIYEPQMFFFIFVGGLVVLFILSRIARVKSPKLSKKDRKKLAIKAEKKAAKLQQQVKD